MTRVASYANEGNEVALPLNLLQRRVKRWRAAHGPDQEVVLAQQHRPGEAAQTDFTHATELAVTIAGQLAPQRKAAAQRSRPPGPAPKKKPIIGSTTDTSTSSLPGGRIRRGSHG